MKVLSGKVHHKKICSEDDRELYTKKWEDKQLPIYQEQKMRLITDKHALLIDNTWYFI